MQYFFGSGKSYGLVCWNNAVWQTRIVAMFRTIGSADMITLTMSQLMESLRDESSRKYIPELLTDRWESITLS